MAKQNFLDFSLIRKKFCLFICHFRMDKTVMAWYNKGTTKKARGFYYG